MEQIDQDLDTSLKNRSVRSVYLITCSQVDSRLSREAFAEVVVNAFESTDPNSKSKLLQWVCSQEKHKDGGQHFHMAVKLSSRRRWMKVREHVDNHHNLKLNFSSRHVNYYSAYQYTTKEDLHYIESTNHPVLTNAPKTQQASERSNKKRTKTAKKDQKRVRKSRLSVYEVSQIAVEKGIKTRLEFLALAKSQKDEGKTDLAEFIANRGLKNLDEAISIGWEMENAPSTLERTRQSRLETLTKLLSINCIDGCQGQWLTMVKEVLRSNEINENEFSQAVQTLLVNGRGKYRNIMILGAANCGKTFLLNPLNAIYNCFTNPATTSFAWVGAQDSEVIFLNDFRWSSQIIPWHDLLLLLEGQTVHLPAPKSHFSKDIVFENDSPIFCTSKDEITFVRGGVLDQRETEMMSVRWKIFHFHYQIPFTQQKSVPACPRCFSELILKF